MTEPWLDEWLKKHPGFRLAEHGEDGAMWLSEDGWISMSPARRRPPFDERDARSWALIVRDTTGEGE